MSDSYQAIYDAVRSRISNGDIGAAVSDAFHAANIGHYIECAATVMGYEVAKAVEAYTAPSAVFRPDLSIDGNCWCALYGRDLQSGVAGFGDSPEKAMHDFDANWKKSLKP